MTSFPIAPAAPAAAPNLREHLAAAIATVEKLLDCADSLTSLAEKLQDQLPPLLDQLNEEAATDNIWVRVIAKTPEEVEHEAVPHGSRPWWVVYVGCEPGLYTTIEEADLQIKGCPNQQYRRKSSKFEALSYYQLMHSADKV
ncbi:hypothetical protein B0H13DRAFT_2381242 [Mycena leptocephala]|nr:hypothetical protein B0H13DRAFT_2381242 [Mycena leptocephala]